MHVRRMCKYEMVDVRQEVKEKNLLHCWHSDSRI